MKNSANSMAHEQRRDRIVLGGNIVMDGLPNVLERSTWSTCCDGHFECSIGYINKVSATVVLRGGKILCSKKGIHRFIPHRLREMFVMCLRGIHSDRQ